MNLIIGDALDRVEVSKGICPEKTKRYFRSCSPSRHGWLLSFRENWLNLSLYIWNPSLRLFIWKDICNQESRKDISVGFSRPFEFRVAWCYKSESLAGMVAYVSKHQSLDIFEFRNIEFKQIFQKQIWRNDLGRLNWQHVIFTLFSHIGLVEKPLTTRCKI